MPNKINRKNMEKEITERVNEIHKMDRESPEFKESEGALVEILYNYTLGNRRDAERFGVEIDKAARDSIKYYNPENPNSDFLHYYNHNCSNNIEEEKGKEQFDNSHGGLSISEKKREKFNEFIGAAKEAGFDPLGPELAEWRESLGIKEEELKIYVEGTYQLDYTDEANPVGTYIERGYREVEDDIPALFETVDRIYQNSRGRTDALSSQITSDMAEIIAGFGLEKEIEGYDFFDKETYKRYLKRGKKEMQIEIAERVGISNNSLNRIKKNFKEKLKEELLN